MDDRTKLEVIRLVMNDEFDKAREMLYEATEPDPVKLPPLSREEWLTIRTKGTAHTVMAYRTRTGCNLRESKAAVDLAIGEFRASVKL